MPLLPTSDNITPTTDELTVTQVNSTSVSEEITGSGTSSSSFEGHHLDQMDFFECSLTDPELHTLKQFLVQSSDVFSQNDQVGFADIVKHKIELSDYQPFYGSGTSSSSFEGHHLDQMDFFECSLTDPELHTLKQFLVQSSDVFSQNDQVGFADIVKHKIELSDYQPF